MPLVPCPSLPAGCSVQASQKRGQTLSTKHRVCVRGTPSCVPTRCWGLPCSDSVCPPAPHARCARSSFFFPRHPAARVLEAKELLAAEKIPVSTVDLMSSHGQTISGHPHWELGDVSVVAQRTGVTCAGDFRPADVAAGGNGTPCTCTYDTIMLRPEAGTDKWRIGINIGTGIGTGIDIGTGSGINPRILIEGAS